ncbi:hypothetical protein [Micromonospora sp. NBC_01412]|uniref:hypothetical protein n=1 Tax=Micromonospora sp. NBC_01412 TaxID=2903590 RepID=UPI00324F2803
MPRTAPAAPAAPRHAPPCPGRSAPVGLGRDYRLLWSAAVSSRFGDSLHTPALALLAAPGRWP